MPRDTYSGASVSRYHPATNRPLPYGVYGVKKGRRTWPPWVWPERTTAGPGTAPGWIVSTYPGACTTQRHGSRSSSPRVAAATSGVPTTGSSIPTTVTLALPTRIRAVELYNSSTPAIPYAFSPVARSIPASCSQFPSVATVATVPRAWPARATRSSRSMRRLQMSPVSATRCGRSRTSCSSVARAAGWMPLWRCRSVMQAIRKPSSSCERPGTGTSCRVTSLETGSMRNPSPSAAAATAPAVTTRNRRRERGKDMGGNLMGAGSRERGAVERQTPAPCSPLPAPYLAVKPLNPIGPALSLGGAERRGGARQQVLRLDRCVARVADGIVAGAQARCCSGQRLDPAGEALGQEHGARAVGAGCDHRELSRADAPDRVGAAGRAAQHVGEQVHRGGVLPVGRDRRECHAGERLGVVERLQRQLLRAQREAAHGIEPGRVGDARLAARAVAVELQQHVGVELGGDLFGVERMAQEFPDAGPQRGVMLGRRRSLGGDQEERRARAHVGVVAQCARRGERVHVGERLVEHHEIGWRGVRLLERLGAAVRAVQGLFWSQARTLSASASPLMMAIRPASVGWR